MKLSWQRMATGLTQEKLAELVELNVRRIEACEPDETLTTRGFLLALPRDSVRFFVYGI